MELSSNELGIIVVGIAVGYWVVSYAFSDRNSRQNKSVESDSPIDGSATGESMNGAAQGAVQPWWVVLGVSPNASRAEIARAYKKRISEYHPDKVAHMGEEIRALAVSRAQQINSAYDEALRKF